MYVFVKFIFLLLLLFYFIELNIEKELNKLIGGDYKLKNKKYGIKPSFDGKSFKNKIKS